MEFEFEFEILKRNGCCSGPKQSDALRLFGGRDVFQQHLSQSSGAGSGGSACNLMDAATGRVASPASAHKKKRSIAGIALVSSSSKTSHPASPVGAQSLSGNESCVTCLPSPKNRRLEWTLTASSETPDSCGSSDSIDTLATCQQRHHRPSTVCPIDLNSYLCGQFKSDAKRLTFSETVALFQSFAIGMRKDLVDLFVEWSVPKPSQVAETGADKAANGPGKEAGTERVIGPANLQQFMESQQHESCSLDAARDLIRRFESDPVLRANCFMSYEAFAVFMNDASNFAFRSEHLQPKDEHMHYPLSHYYIASSHNTYLTGHQLKGKYQLTSSVVIRRLRQAPMK